MKSFDQFHNESFVGKAVGLMNKAATAAKGVAQKAANIKVAKPTTGPLVAPKKHFSEGNHQSKNRKERLQCNVRSHQNIEEGH